MAKSTHNIISFLSRNFVNQQSDCAVWNRLYRSVRSTIVRHDDFYLLVGFIPVGVGAFLTSVARVEYEDWVASIDTGVLVEILKCLDDRGSSSFFVE